MTSPPSRTDRFFNFIRRLNSVVLSLLLLAGAGFMAFLWWESRPSAPTGPTAPPQVVDTAAGESETVDLDFTDAERIESARTDMLRLITSTGSVGSYGSRRKDVARNVLFISDGETTGRWLFKDHKNIVHALHELPEASRDANDSETLAIYVEFNAIRAGSQSATHGGPVDVGLARPDGKELTTVLRGVRVLSRRVADGRLHITFQRDAAVWQAEIALADFRESGKRQVAKVPQSL
ncbi:hypothetical protein [Massilia sp. METH4]|uniref:hypothetical protein n=1 Tax=Massilia sp. METH4 TaxID=3123041 RepID=UPI0030D5BEFE